MRAEKRRYPLTLILTQVQMDRLQAAREGRQMRGMNLIPMEELIHEAVGVWLELQSKYSEKRESKYSPRGGRR